LVGFSSNRGFTLLLRHLHCYCCNAMDVRFISKQAEVFVVIMIILS